MWEAKLTQAADFLRERDDFLVVSHVQPDGDAISSTVAIGWMLHRLGKTFAMMNEGPVPSRLRFLWKSGDIMGCGDGEPERKFRHVIAVDCADFARVGPAQRWFEDGYDLLNIDHHPTNDAYGSVNLLRFDAAATAEILYELAVHMGFSLDADIASALYTGLLTDTGGFRYSNTSPFVMEAASRLLEAGAPGPMLAEELLERMSMGQMRMIQRGLSRLAFSDDQRIGWIWVTSEDLEETGASNEDLEGLVNYPRNIEGVEVGVLFKENGAKSVKVSMRSAGRVNVAEAAKHFGGGGHVRAAGCRLTVPLAEAMEQVIAYLRKELEAP
ncbi:bifunctional oligoribonuclease/PAP phosphatase NrnA [Cohnella sp. CFH 77786]|uniref:DHH family phosphoesterase n=1 Tax=Cohnella sp. CFH 77786 TaxID=2662265 RepID=UPI001C60E00A|nr:bifunctional oligoribonuclease/PAP phosphatase NrnA [Cohnella sp. CFH 77786]MBW5444528.1 bifunctional oligoribonuclease/PAP phosphatase NrnA [Cohnella sp. CFH 77786]